MGQIGSFIAQNPQLAQMGAQAMSQKGGKGGGMSLPGIGGGEKETAQDPGKLPEGEKTGFQSMAESIDQVGQTFDNFADSQFAATEEYKRQRAQGMPEAMKPQLQDVKSAADSKELSNFEKGQNIGDSLKGIFGDNKPAMESDMDVEMPDTDVQSVEDEDNKLAKMNALKGLIV